MVPAVPVLAVESRLLRGLAFFWHKLWPIEGLAMQREGATYSRKVSGGSFGVEGDIPTNDDHQYSQL